MIVEQLLLIRSGTYDDVHVRPYVMDTSNGNLIPQLQEQTHWGKKTEASNLAGIAGQMLAPSAAPIGVVAIAAGWGQARCRFLLRLRHDTMGGDSQIQYLTGYTDYDGINEFSGSVDGKMRLFVNNTITTRVFNKMGAGGTLIPQLRVKEAAQVLQGSVVTDFRKMDNAMHTVRPEDIFAQIGAQHEDTSLGPVNDMRSAFHTSPLRLSRRINGSASDYMSTILSTYRTSLRSQDNAVQDWAGLANQMSGVVREATPMSDPFLGEMIRMGTSLSEGSSFTYNELGQFAKFLHENTKIVGMDVQERNQLPTRSLGDQAHVGNPWASQHWEPQIATIAMHAIAANMADLMLTSVTFQLTNRVIGGQPRMDITGAMGFVHGIPLTDFLTTLQQRTLASVYRDLTRNGMVDVEVGGTINLMGNSHLIVKYQERPPVVFDTPTFADAINAPVVAYSQQNVNNLAMEFDTLANALSMDLSVEAYQPEPQIAMGPIGGGGGYSGPAI